MRDTEIEEARDFWNSVAEDWRTHRWAMKETPTAG